MDQQPRPHDGGRSADPIHKQGEIVSDKYKQSKDNSTITPSPDGSPDNSDTVIMLLSDFFPSNEFDIEHSAFKKRPLRQEPSVKEEITKNSSVQSLPLQQSEVRFNHDPQDKAHETVATNINAKSDAVVPEFINKNPKKFISKDRRNANKVCLNKAADCFNQTTQSPDKSPSSDFIVTPSNKELPHLCFDPSELSTDSEENNQTGITADQIDFGREKSTESKYKKGIEDTAAETFVSADSNEEGNSSIVYRQNVIDITAVVANKSRKPATTSTNPSKTQIQDKPRIFRVAVGAKRTNLLECIEGQGPKLSKIPCIEEAVPKEKAQLIKNVIHVTPDGKKYFRVVNSKALNHNPCGNMADSCSSVVSSVPALSKTTAAVKTTAVMIMNDQFPIGSEETIGKKIDLTTQPFVSKINKTKPGNQKGPKSRGAKNMDRYHGGVKTKLDHIHEDTTFVRHQTKKVDDIQEDTTFMRREMKKISAVLGCSDRPIDNSGAVGKEEEVKRLFNELKDRVFRWYQSPTSSTPTASVQKIWACLDAVCSDIIEEMPR